MNDCTVTSFHLTWQHSRELLVDVVLELMDVVLDGHVSVRLHVSNICILPLTLGGGISTCGISSFPSSWSGTASSTLMPFDATGKSLPRWRLALPLEAKRGKKNFKGIVKRCAPTWKKRKKSRKNN